MNSALLLLRLLPLLLRENRGRNTTGDEKVRHERPDFSSRANSHKRTDARHDGRQLRTLHGTNFGEAVILQSVEMSLDLLQPVVNIHHLSPARRADDVNLLCDSTVKVDFPRFADSRRNTAGYVAHGKRHIFSC